MYHGELVAFGTIVQLVLEKRCEQELAEVMQFCTSVGLPVSFAEISTRELTREELMNVAVTACSPANFMDSEPFEVTPEMTFEALIAADALGKKYAAKERATVRFPDTQKKSGKISKSLSGKCRVSG